jgi:hypothetical protein
MYTDCEIKFVTPKGTIIIPASRFVLSNNSEYFCGLFKHNDMKPQTLQFEESENDLKYVIEWVHKPINKVYVPHPDNIIGMLLMAQKFMFPGIVDILCETLVNTDIISSIDDEIVINEVLTQLNSKQLDVIINNLKILNPLLFKFFLDYSNQVGFIPQNLIRLLNRNKLFNDNSTSLKVPNSLREGFSYNPPIYPNSTNEIFIPEWSNGRKIPIMIVRMADLIAIDYGYLIRWGNPINCPKFGVTPEIGYECSSDDFHTIEFYGNSHPSIKDWDGNGEECLLYDDDLGIFEDYGDLLDAKISERNSR